MKINRRNKYKSDTYNNEKKKNRIDINFDITALNLMCSYILSENANIKRSHLVNMKNLFDLLNIDIYINDDEKLKRTQFIKKGLIGRLENNIKNPSLLVQFINGGLGEENLIDLGNLIELNNQEIEWINDTVYTSLKFSFIYNDIPRLMDVCTRFQAEDYRNRGDIVNEVEEMVKNLQTKFRRSKPENDITDAVFCLRDNFENTVTESHGRLTNKSRKLHTGMQGFNELLGGAFQAGRVYMLLGLTGGGKSLTLLDLAYQMKKYNRYYKPKDRTKTPLILYITQENNIDESIDRLFSISTGYNSIENYSPQEVIELLKTEGELVLNDITPIDIMMKFIPDRSIDTNDIYSLLEDLEDDGYEVICIVQDHVKKMRSATRQADIRQELGAIINEFKTIANLKDLIFITNSHLNRDAASKIEEATKANKSDLIRLLGSANIGESLLMLDNIDGAFMIAQEYDETGNKYLGIQRLKKRYYASDRNVIFQPYIKADGITLVEDYDMQVPQFKTTLKNGPTGTNMFNNKPGKYNVKSIDELTKPRKNPENNQNIQQPLSILEDPNIFNSSRYRATPLNVISEDEIIGNDECVNIFIKH